MVEWRLELFMKPAVYHALKLKADLRQQTISEYVQALIEQDAAAEITNLKNPLI